jgi:hypothetical protein
LGFKVHKGHKAFKAFKDQWVPPASGVPRALPVSAQLDFKAFRATLAPKGLVASPVLSAQPEQMV